MRLGEFLPAALALCRHRRQLLGVPLLASPTLLVYDTRRFARAGIAPPHATRPWDWQRLLEAIPPLTRDTNLDGQIDQYGFFPGFGTGGLLSFIWQNGGEVIDAGGRRSRLLEPAAHDAVEFYAELYRRHPPAFTPPPGSVGADLPSGGGFVRSGITWAWNGRGMTIDARSLAPGHEGLALALVAQGISGFSDLDVGPLGQRERPHERQHAAALGVPAVLAVSRLAANPGLAATALALFAEHASKAVDLPPRCRSPAAIRATTITAAANTDNVNALVSTHGYSRSLALDDVQHTERVHAALQNLIAAFQQGYRDVAEPLQRTHEQIQAILNEG